jgi:DNA polymerase-3 subunit beta
MKFSVKTHDFQKAISSVEGIISVREIKSVLSNIKIEVEDDKVSLSATDLEISIRATIQAKTISNGTSSIPAKQLSSTMKTINFLETSLETVSNDEGSSRTLITDAENKVDFKMFINGIESEEIKTIAKVSQDQIVEFPCSTLSGMIRKTSYSVALEDTRFVFNGLYIISSENTLIVVGTDGRRLAKVERTIPNKFPFQKGVIIPHKAIREIVKMLETNETGNIGFIDNQIYLATKDMELQCKLIDGNYPDYEAVIPKETKNRIRIAKDTFQIALRQALIAAEEPTRQLRVGLTKNNLNLSSNNPGATEVSINIPIEYEGEDTMIAFKGDYVVDVVKSIEDHEIIIEFNNSNAPVLFRDPSDANYVSVIMPMKL